MGKYLIFCKAKTRFGVRERKYSANMPSDYESLRRRFGKDIKTKDFTLKVYKNGVVYTNDKKTGYSVRYIPVKDKIPYSKKRSRR